jgi:hypothetical protein
MNGGGGNGDNNHVVVAASSRILMWSYDGFFWDGDRRKVKMIMMIKW